MKKSNASNKKVKNIDEREEDGDKMNNTNDVFVDKKHVRGALTARD